MTELIPAINEIVKYGLQPGLDIETTDRDRSLEKSLVKIYSLFFEISYEFDNSEYPDFDRKMFPGIRHNIETNFKEFGLYQVISDPSDLTGADNYSIGDAIDDLTDITLDLLQVKWRMENNSLNDGLWYFELMFYGHTQQHILDLLNYMKHKNG
jgi:hypothetical protein